MKTNAIKWHMINEGLKSARMIESTSYCYNDGSLGGEDVIEQFSIQAPDGSSFMVSITKLRESSE